LIRDFIDFDDISKSKNTKSVLKSVFDIVETLDKKLIIEGVEKMEQLKTLLEIDAKEFQGFLFWKPVTIQSFYEDFEKIKMIKK